ncbi:sugar phosphate isomerase [Paenibacillus sp. FSL H7-0326]|uniref:sugar phosphate isomerase/epimerase family protein n=1 Tax=Paenibacillus sp. FSL H7-0326 TaxID=1921144 RepID=UPI00096F71FB|nr:sugar phosphate isomerase/epimerase [Paenibacillus sp. FSL H7-0326]OMC71469.1 sugar phosphate isomerase [Paenibacillus sp. FSL H7-0326]
MGKGKIGVQMMMLKGKVDEIGVYETLREVHKLGYRSVEVSQIPMNSENILELKRASEDLGIEIAALSASVEPIKSGMRRQTLSTDFEKIVQDCKTLNCSFLRIGILPLTSIGDKERILDFVKKADEFAARLAEHGIALYYHNHHVEFQKYDGEYLLDIIKNNTTRLGFEMDVHWIHRGGENPAALIKRYAGRVSLIHLKDYRMGPVNMDFLQIGDMSKFNENFSNIIQFAELGEGSLDLKSIIDAGLNSGAKYFFVEQDELYGRDPFDCLKVSGDHLKALGYSDWF